MPVPRATQGEDFVTRRELAQCCMLTVGIGVLVSWGLARFDVARINQRFDTIELRLNDQPQRITVEGGGANVAIRPSMSDELRESLIEQFAAQLKQDYSNAL